MIDKEAAVIHIGWESKMVGILWLDTVHVLSVFRHNYRVISFFALFYHGDKVALSSVGVP